MVNYCRDFIPGLARITLSLHECLKLKKKGSEEKLKWSTLEEEAYEETKRMIVYNTERARPQMDRPFILTTDASSHEIGAILSQRTDEGKIQMISAFSKKLNEAEINYSVTDKELLAVVKAMEHYRHCLLGKKFTLETDHKAIESIATVKNPTTRLLRWALKLQEFDFWVQYIKEETNAADFLSRPITENGKILRIENLNQIDRKKIIEEYHIIAGHGTGANIKFLMKNKYKWPQVYKEIDEFVDNCKVCLKNKPIKQNTKNRIIETSKPNELWEVDLIGRIQEKEKTNLYLLL